MSALTLATKQLTQLNDLLTGKVPTLEFQLTKVAKAEDVQSGLMSLIPYSTLSCYDPNTGDIHFLALQEPVENAGQMVLGTSVGFGDHISDKADVTCTSMNDLEDGTRVYQMAPRDLIQTGVDACKRQWLDLIGLDPITEFGIDIENMVRFNFFQDPAATSGTDQVRFGLSIPLNISPDQMQQVFAKIAERADQTKQFTQFVFNASKILMTFDVSEVGSQVIKRMATEHNVTPWSVQVISQRLMEYVETLRSHVSYGDIIQAVRKNVDAMRAQAEEANKQMQLQFQEQQAAEQAAAQAAAAQQAEGQAEGQVVQAEQQDAAQAADLEPKAAPEEGEGVQAQAADTAETGDTAKAE